MIENSSQKINKVIKYTKKLRRRMYGRKSNKSFYNVEIF